MENLQYPHCIMQRESSDWDLAVVSPASGAVRGSVMNRRNFVLKETSLRSQLYLGGRQMVHKQRCCHRAARSTRTILSRTILASGVGLLALAFTGQAHAQLCQHGIGLSKGCNSACVGD